MKFQPFDISEDGDLSTSLPLRKRLLHALRNGGQTVKELSESLGVEQTKIRARLNEGKSKEFVVVKKEGMEPKWGLLTAEN